MEVGSKYLNHLVLWLLGLSGFLLSADSIRLEVKAKPGKIDYLATHELTVNCTYGSDDTNLSPDRDQILYLILTKQHPQKGPRELARIDQTSGLHYARDTSQSEPIFHGAISNVNHVSYLSSTWTKISEDLIGSYVCEGGSLTKTGSYVSDFKQTTVMEERKLPQTLLEEVLRLNDLKTKQSHLSNLDAKFFENQRWREKMALSVSYLEKTLLMSEPSGAHRNRVYYESRYVTRDVSSAEAVCQTMGGYLLEINDDDELNFISSTFNNTRIDKHIIAGRFNLTNDKWYWPRTNQMVSFFSWHDGEPNGRHFNEHCLQLLYQYDKQLMNDIPCSLSEKSKIYFNHFICEVPIF